MAVITQIVLGVWRDKNAPFNPDTGKTGYYLEGTSTPDSVGRSFHTACIRGLRNVTESSTTYGSFIYQLNEGSIPEEVLVIQASGAVVTLCNS
jgi:hypothetical protein